MANKEYASAQCKYEYDDAICGWDVEGNLADGLCILHSTDSAKDAHAFAEALATHRERKGDRFTGFVFPEIADFRGATFSGSADFQGARFSGSADFRGARFSGSAGFRGARFGGNADFPEARFSGSADFFTATFSGSAGFRNVTFNRRVAFTMTTFSGNADFLEATFSRGATFFTATFSGGAGFPGATFSGTAGFSALFSGSADFRGARFSGSADFRGARFGGNADFRGATFSGRALFVGSAAVFHEGIDYIFAGQEVYFLNAIIASPDAVTFLAADLTKCRFLDIDLRKVQLVNVKWPRKGRMGRVCIYDEIASETEVGSRRPWSRLERLYRELKQNHEDRRDYERAGDFHYGEKQMRRQSPDTARGLRFFLTLYWLFSGYGERYLRPLFWAGLLFIDSTIGYMWWGLCPKTTGRSILAWTNGWDWLQGIYYSFRVMVFLKPDDWVPVSYAHLVNTFQTLLGPLFLGLFALALRQRLKR
jgi:uncharacterized protein YjbI with pentapeptide repeats